MKKTEILRKSERFKDFDPEVLKDLKVLCGSKKWKTHLKKLHLKKKKSKKHVNSFQLAGVLGFASLIRETDPVPQRAATHVTIAHSILNILNNCD
jgi:hypothetical protein